MFYNLIRYQQMKFYFGSLNVSNVILFTLIVSLIMMATRSLTQLKMNKLGNKFNINIINRFCSSFSQSEDNLIPEKDKVKEWDIKSLKFEVSRVYGRTFKKIGKANDRLAIVMKEYNDIINTENVELARLEACGNPETLQKELKDMQILLSKLFGLEEELKNIKSTSDVRFPNIALLATELNISDTPQVQQERGPKKVKGKPMAPRKPYHIYTSISGVEIRVGRGASDNDELSCNPVHRDGADWWLHVAGCAGSHVVIRSHDDTLPDNNRETLLDAALLAVINSKGSQSGRVPVTYTRCRQVTKPKGAKAGLVHLGGDVGTIRIDVKAEAKRLERLESTKEGTATF